MNQNYKPSEEIYEFIFSGHFNPQRYDMSWFFKNDIFDVKEETEFSNIIVDERNMKFSTPYLNFYVNNSKFSISTNNTIYFDLLKDMANLIVSVIKNDFDNTFELKWNRHFSMESHSKAKSGMKKIFPLDNWTNILSKPKIDGFVIRNESKQKKFDIIQSIVVSHCNRSENSKDIHIFIKNKITLERIALLNKIDGGIGEILNKSQEISNHILKTYFYDR